MPTMPASTQRAHFDPAWRGDSFAGIDTVAKQSPGEDGVRAIDNNFQWFWRRRRRLGRRRGIAFALHWRDPGKNNFRYILDGGRVRPMTRAELRRTRWTAEQVRRWRRGPSRTSAAPRTYAAMVRHAVAKDVVICAELKSPAFRRRVPAQTLVAAAKRAGHPPWYMALYGSMPYCRGKCKAVVNAGGEFAVIFGRYQHHRTYFRRAVRSWRVKPTRVW